MTSAGELFVVALARASRRARRHLRGLDPAARDDILATAILWCWENRATYSPVVSLDTWFVSAIRHAKQAWARSEAHTVAELIEAIAAPEDTSAQAELLQLEDRLQKRLEAMSVTERKIAALQVRGHTQDEIVQRLRVSAATVSDVRRKLAPLKRLLPDNREWCRVVRKSQSLDSDDIREPAPIDKEIERLEFAPPAGKDCPPCWRCKWFDGYLPTPNTKRRDPITVEPDIRAAVLSIEARKVEIAKQIRYWRR